jgi:integration host factor subunit beta
LAINKSDIVNQLKKSYPNFLKRDLALLISIVLHEIKRALKRGDSCELRGFGRWSPRIQKARLSRNPATGQKVNTPEKISIHWKQSKEMFKKINNKNEE